MKVLVTPTSFGKPENAAARAKIEAFADEVVYNDLGRPLQPAELIERLEGCDAFLAGVDYITAEVIENAPASLKMISRYGAGVDRVDIPAATAKGIMVANVQKYCLEEVSDHAMALMLTLVRKTAYMKRSNARKAHCSRLSLTG